MREFGLYYPYVHFRNDDWLKVAALYWPSMARLAAKGLPKRDTDVARELAETLDFVVDVDPAPAAAAVGVTFVNLAREHGAQLRTVFEVSDADLVVSEREKERQERQHDRFWDPPEVSTPMRDPPEVSTPMRAPGSFSGAPLGQRGHGGGRVGDHPPRPLTGLHREHLAAELAEALLEEGLAVTPRGHGEWLGVAPELAWIYMCALTEEAAQQNKLAPTTDQIGAHTASDLWHPDRLTAALFREPDPSAAVPGTVDAQMVALTAVNLVVPANIRSVPVRDIVKLRNRYRDDFNAFLDQAATVADDLSSELAESEVRDPNVLQRHLNDEVKDKFDVPLSNLKKALRDARIDSALSTVNMKVELPGLLASGAGGELFGSLVAQGPVAAASGALAFWVVSRWRTAHSNQAKIRTGPAAYLLRLEKDLDPRSMVGHVGDSLHKLSWPGV
jgi:hypothetical protein